MGKNSKTKYKKTVKIVSYIPTDLGMRCSCGGRKLLWLTDISDPDYKELLIEVSHFVPSLYQRIKQVLKLLFTGRGDYWDEILLEEWQIDKLKNFLRLHYKEHPKGG